MEVYFFQEARPACRLEETVEYLTSFVDKSFGCLWLRHENGTQLAIMINGCQAYPHFFPADSHPGWQIEADKHDDDWETYVDFLADNQEPTPTPLALVIPVNRAIPIVVHYWKTGTRSETENWSNLLDDL